MDLWQLHVFCKVVEYKSFSSAGRAVHLSQPTVSSHIKDLENHFHCRLIDRLSKEAVPTRAGELLYDYAVRLIALRDEAEAAISEFHGTIKGRLLIGGSTIPGVYLLPPIIAAFMEENPEVTLSLRIGDTEAVVAEVVSGALEVAIVGAASPLGPISQEKIAEDEMCLVVPTGHRWAAEVPPVRIEDLPTEPFILREDGSGTRKSFEERLAQSGRGLDDLNVVAEMGSTQAVIQGIRNNLGVSILSRVAVSEAASAGDLAILPVQGLDLKRSFYLTRHRHRTPSPLCRAFLEFLKGKTPTGGPAAEPAT